MAKLYENLTRKINESEDISEIQKQELLKSILQDKDRKPHVLITGATGCGKSSTINALFNAEKAKVGTSPDPETMEITKYELGNLTLWDSPGLGDGTEADKRHAQGIIKLLKERDENGNLLIDVVLVILDGRSRDLGTSYELISTVIAPYIENNERLLIGINQADMAMSGRHWNRETHTPDETLNKFLEEKEASIQRRIREATGIEVSPISYSAGYKEDGMPQEPAYNLSKLLYYIIESIPAEKRLIVLEHLNEDKQMWERDDGTRNWRGDIVESAERGIVSRLGGAAKGAAAGAAAGAAIGSFIPVVGTAVGSAVGAAIGFVGGLFGF